MSQEDFDIINNETKKEKYINYLKKNKKKLVGLLFLILFIILSYFAYTSYKVGQKEDIAEKYNIAALNYNSGNNSETILNMKEIILKRDKTYSPLALYFLIDNNLVLTNSEINKYFDIIINDVNLTPSNKYLNIYKKTLFNADFVSEQELLSIINPVLKEENEWKSHALYLMAEYYFENKQFNKSKEFYNNILTLKDSNQNIKLEAKIRLQRDFSDKKN